MGTWSDGSVISCKILKSYTNLTIREVTDLLMSMSGDEAELMRGADWERRWRWHYRINLNFQKAVVVPRVVVVVSRMVVVVFPRVMMMVVSRMVVVVSRVVVMVLPMVVVIVVPRVMVMVLVVPRVMVMVVSR